jgi:hypothetical protein
MIIKEPEKKRSRKRRHLRKRKTSLGEEEKAILSPVNLPVEDRVAPPVQEVPSLWDKLFRLFVGEIKSADEQRRLAPAMDPMRTIFAIPDGIGRLEAFKEMLQQTPASSFYFRSIALSFRRHIMDMLEEAQLPPASVDHYLEPCIEALEDAGLHADAQILTDLPLFEPYIPKQIFLNANETRDLESVDQEIAFGAKTSFRDFEIEMLKNHRDAAFKHLQRAVQQAPGNPEYQATYEHFVRKKTSPFMIDLENKGQQLRICSGQQFIWGRSKQAALHHLDPHISREHAVFSYVGAQQWALTQLEFKTYIQFENEPWRDGILPSQGTLSLNQHQIRFQVIEHGLLLHLIKPLRRTILLTSLEQIPIPFIPQETFIALNLLFNAEGHPYLVPTQQTLLNREAVRRKVRILKEDVLSNPTQSWTLTQFTH